MCAAFSLSPLLAFAGIAVPLYQSGTVDGKPYKVYMIASANKFLRHCYTIVKAHLDELDRI